MGRIVYFLGAIMFLMAFQCDDDQCISMTMQSSISLEVKPENIEYDIQDTIWISQELGSDLDLTDSEETISLVNGAVTNELFIVKLNSDLSVGNGFEDFEVLPVTGTIDVSDFSNAIGQLEFLCDSVSCKFEVGLVSKNRGSYSIGMGNGGAFKSITSVCEPQIQLTNNSFEVDDLHKSVYEELGFESSIRIPWGDRVRNWGLDSDGVYSFRVR